jgi:hypothetical protein
MRKPYWVASAIAIVCLAFGVNSASAQKLEVSVLYRQNSGTDYKALVPGFTNPSSPDCAADLANADCYNQTHATETDSTPSPVPYSVTGTTLSLLLPDGRVAVVNCINKYSKYSPKGDYISRGCGMPLVERVQVEFKGKIARLEWPVGSDGKKIESEKYKIVAVLEKR